MSTPGPRPNSHSGRSSACAADPASRARAPTARDGMGWRTLLKGSQLSGGGRERTNPRRLDLDEQILAADVGLKKNGARVLTQRLVEVRLNDRQIDGSAHIDLAGQRAQRETRARSGTVGLGEQRLDV